MSKVWPCPQFSNAGHSDSTSSRDTCSSTGNTTQRTPHCVLLQGWDGVSSRTPKHPLPKELRQYPHPELTPMLLITLSPQLIPSSPVTAKHLTALHQLQSIIKSGTPCNRLNCVSPSPLPSHPLKNSYVEALTASSSECHCIWRQGL